VAIWGPLIVVNRDLFFVISRRLYADKIEAINNISRKSYLSIYKTWWFMTHYLIEVFLWVCTYVFSWKKKNISSCPTVLSSVPDFANFRQSLVKFTSGASVEPNPWWTLPAMYFVSTYWWHWVFTKTYSCS